MIRICRHRLPSRSFATKGAKKKVAAGTIVPKDAVHMAKAGATAKFDETIEVAVRLNLDPRKPNQAVRRSIQLPHGTGKSVRVAVFAKGDNIDLATEAGADVVGGEELVDAILKGKIDFDRCIASPDMMPLVGRVARILGPKGLMPNPKLGTVTPNVANAVKAAKKGQIQIRTEKNGIVHAPIGKASFTEEMLLDNLKSLMMAMQDAKPTGAPKGKYLMGVCMSSTMGKGIRLEIDRVNPASSLFMRNQKD